MSQNCRAVVQSVAHRFLAPASRSYLPGAEEYGDDYYVPLNIKEREPARTALAEASTAQPQTASPGSSRSSEPAPRKRSIFSSPLRQDALPSPKIPPSVNISQVANLPPRSVAGPSSVGLRSPTPAVGASGLTPCMPARGLRIATGAVSIPETPTATTPEAMVAATAAPLPSPSVPGQLEAVGDTSPQATNIRIPVVVFSPAAHPRDVSPVNTPIEPALAVPPAALAKPVDVPPAPSSPARSPSPPGSASPTQSPNKRQRDDTDDTTSPFPPDDAPAMKKAKKIPPKIWAARRVEDTIEFQRAKAALDKANGEPSNPSTPSRQSKRLLEKGVEATATSPKTEAKTAPKRATPLKCKRAEDEDEDDYSDSPKGKRTKCKPAEVDLDESSASDQRDDDGVVQPLALRRTRRKAATSRKPGA